MPAAVNRKHAADSARHGMLCVTVSCCAALPTQHSDTRPGDLTLPSPRVAPVDVLRPVCNKAGLRLGGWFCSGVSHRLLGSRWVGMLLASWQHQNACVNRYACSILQGTTSIMRMQCTRGENWMLSIGGTNSQQATATLSRLQDAMEQVAARCKSSAWNFPAQACKRLHVLLLSGVPAGYDNQPCTKCGEGLTTASKQSTRPTDCEALPGWQKRAPSDGFGEQCPVGSYSQGGKDSCHKCPLGSSTLYAASSSASQCTVCAPGGWTLCGRAYGVSLYA